MIHVSEHFGLPARQPQLDFVDVPIDRDTPLFLDPRALLTLESDWGHECVALIQHYFGCVLRAIRSGDRDRAAALLSQLHEPNETRLGLSQGRPAGHALGPELSVRVLDALASSVAVTSGLLTDLEDTILLIDGISNDLVSDIATNVLREPLVRYTQQACEDHGIPMVGRIYPGGPLWDVEREGWRQELVRLPRAAGRPLLLVPKAIVRKKMDFDADEYYRDYIIPYLREQEIEAGSSLVQVIKKTGNPHVTQVALAEKYGRGKAVNEKWTQAHPQLLDEYRNAKDKHIQPALPHSELAEITGTAPPDWDAMVAAVTRVRPGNAGAGRYHRAVEGLLSALFYPALSSPESETRLHAGRKRVDITFVNSATEGFFHWLGQHYVAPYVMVECKNYTGDPANPELDQLAGRFSPRRGEFGLLLCRTITDKPLFTARCRDTAEDDRGYIIALDDVDLRELVEARKSDDPQATMTSLRERFNALIM